MPMPSYFATAAVVPASVRKLENDAIVADVKFATGEPVEVGETVKVKATVKKHEVYKDRKQTQLNRVAIA